MVKQNCSVITALLLACIPFLAIHESAKASEWGEKLKTKGMLVIGSVVCKDKYVFFCGHKDLITAKHLNAKYNDLNANNGAIANQLYRYDTQGDCLEPCVKMSDVEKIFGGSMDVSEQCNFVLSPTGRLLAIGKIVGKPGLNITDIVLINPQEKKMKVLVSDGLNNVNYSISPDDRYLLYFAYPADSLFKQQGGVKAKPGSVRLIDLTMGDVQTIKAPSEQEMEVVHFYLKHAWSSDGKKVAFSDWENGSYLYCYDVNTKSLNKVGQTKNLYSEVLFADNERILTTTGSELHLIDAQTGKFNVLASGDSLRNVRIDKGRIFYQVGLEVDKNMQTVDLPGAGLK